MGAGGEGPPARSIRSFLQLFEVAKTGDSGAKILFRHAGHGGRAFRPAAVASLGPYRTGKAFLPRRGTGRCRHRPLRPPTEAIVLIVGARSARPLGGGARALSPNASQSLPCVRGGGAQRRRGCNAVLVNFRVNPPVSLAADSSGLPRNLPGPRCGPPRPVAAGPLGSLFLPQTALPCGPFTQGGLWCGG